jgi:preprotein translocase subunit SecA
LELSDVRGIKINEIERLIKEQAKDEIANKISLSLGEYLEDYEDRETWDVSGLCRWAMSAFSVSLSPSKVKHQLPEEIEEQLIQAAAEQIERKDCARLVEFLKSDFGSERFSEWAMVKFGVKLDAAELAELSVSDTKELLRERTAEKYRQREIEYPVEFAMNMVYGPEGPNVYAYESLAEWVNKKYDAGFSVEKIQNTKPQTLHKQLLELSESFNDGKLEEEIAEKSERFDKSGLVNWANERFGVSLSETDVGEDEVGDRVRDAAREFLRRELSDLEKYVLTQVYDSTWKGHLYAMDHLKNSIWMRSFAERDPKIEYKREGFRMFDEMLDSIEDRVTDIIFKVHLEAGARARSVWNVSQAAHDEVGQFAMAERQRAAAQAPQGEVKVKQIRLEKPKVGRNEPCPCGSGKKYKKCCGRGVV